MKRRGLSPVRACQGDSTSVFCSDFLKHAYANESVPEQIITVDAEFDSGDVTCLEVKNADQMFDSVMSITGGTVGQMKVISMVYGQWPLDEQSLMLSYAGLLKCLQSGCLFAAVIVFPSGKLSVAYGRSLASAMNQHGEFAIALEFPVDDLTIENGTACVAVLLLSKEVCDVLPGIMVDSDRHLMRVEPNANMVIDI